MDKDEEMPLDEDALLPSGSSCDEDLDCGPSSDEEDNFKPQNTNSKSKSEEVSSITKLGFGCTSTSKTTKKTVPPPSKRKRIALKAEKQKAAIAKPTVVESAPASTLIKKNTKECPICGKRISNVHYPAHVKSVHGDERPFKCDTCGSGFSSNSHLKRHQATHRSKAKIVMKKLRYCRFCQWGFFRKDLLTQHEIIHEDSDEFKCTFVGCQLSFFSKERLDEHSLIHNDPVPFKCPKCSKGFRRRDYLGDHMRRAYKLSLDEYLDSISTYDTVLTSTLSGSYVVLTPDMTVAYEAEAMRSVPLGETDVKRGNVSSKTEDKVETEQRLDSESDDDDPAIMKAKVSYGTDSESNNESEDPNPKTSTKNKRQTRQSLRSRKLSPVKKAISPANSSEDENSGSGSETSGDEGSDYSDLKSNRDIPSSKKGKRKSTKDESPVEAKSKQKKSSADDKEKSPRKEEKKECEICGRKIKRMAEHIRRFHDKIQRKGDITKCGICGKSINAYHLNDHIKFVHQKVRPLKCHICRAAFALPSKLKAHLLIHTNPVVTAYKKCVKCQFCQWGFYTKNLLMDHLKLHDKGEKFPCTYTNCNYSFYSKEMLSEHCKVMHEDPTPFKCPKCEKQYGGRQGLCDHIRVIHRITLDAYLGSISTNETVVSATCTILKGAAEPGENNEFQDQDSS